MFGPYTAFGTLYNLVHDISALIGTGTTRIIRDIIFFNNSLRLTYGDGTTSNIDLGDLNLMAFSNKLLEDTTKDQLLKEAFANFLCYLPDLTQSGYDSFLNLPAAQNSGSYSRRRGKMLRFFNSTSTGSNYNWTIKDNGIDIFTILPQEAYTMVWSINNLNVGSWAIIPGIINPANRPDDYIFEGLPNI